MQLSNKADKDDTYAKSEISFQINERVITNNAELFVRYATISSFAPKLKDYRV